MISEEVEQRGAGEILFASMDKMEPKQALPMEHWHACLKKSTFLSSLRERAGNVIHFIDTFTTGSADAALAASIFHFGEISVPNLKQALKAQQIAVESNRMKLNFSKSIDGLLLTYTIVQDATTKTVLMLGYMNEESAKSNPRHRKSYLL